MGCAGGGRSLHQIVDDAAHDHAERAVGPPALELRVVDIAVLVEKWVDLTFREDFETWGRCGKLSVEGDAKIDVACGSDLNRNVVNAFLNHLGVGIHGHYGINLLFTKGPKLGTRVVAGISTGVRAGIRSWIVHCFFLLLLRVVDVYVCVFIIVGCWVE